MPFLIAQKEVLPDVNDKFRDFISMVRNESKNIGCSFYITTHLMEAMKKENIAKMQVLGCFVSEDFLNFDFHVIIREPGMYKETFLRLTYANHEYEKFKVQLG